MRITFATRTQRPAVAFFLNFRRLENRLRGHPPFLSFVGKSRLHLTDASGKFFACSVN